MSELRAMNEEPEARFVVDDDSKAEWCLEKIREANRDKETWKAHFEGQYAKIAAECDETIQKMEMLLEEYFRNVPHRKTATQESYPLKGGKLVFKKQQPEFDRNDEKLIPWLEKNKPEFVKVKKQADWDGLKKVCAVIGNDVVDDEGEIVPGVTAKERPNIFKVEVK